MHRIISATPDAAFRVTLVFDDGVEGSIDFGPMIAKGGVFSALAEADTFRKVSIGDGSRSLEWPGDVDLCADALWMEITGSELDTERPVA
jgi:hypothetical protein